ncbi:YkgJ family cysteine cluster protein [Cupriavidus pauculus]|nr:YkgJ family cysteine cluster protein [Cupriavidus pauculus]
MVDGDRVAVGFQCTACGKCCNSPPLMSMDELFRHAGRFVGALSLRRVRPPRVGIRHVVDGHLVEVTADDVAAFAALARRQGHPLPNGDVLMIATQAIDYPSRGRCPALADDGRCTIHASRPSTCAMVPLDAWVPDRLQAVSLAAKRRGGDHDIGADCLAVVPSTPSPSPSRPRPGGHIPLVVAGAVADRDYAAALARRRDDEADDKHQWGDAVYRLLAPELLGPARGIESIPFAGYRTLPLVPVLAVLANGGPETRARCLSYIGAQRRLIAASLEAALARRRVDDKPMTAQLRQFDATLSALGQRLAH